MEILGLVDVPLYLMLTVVTVLLCYIYLTWNHNFFKKQGIPGPKPYPYIGNTLGRGLMKSFEKWKKTYGNVYGVFLGREPVYVITDLDILKEVFVKSFSNFRNRRKLRLVPYPFNLGVFFLEDAAWKRVRNIITPTFSSGKLRAMCPAINDCACTLTTNFSKTFSQDKSVDMKEYFGAYTMDVISRTAFGVVVDSQNNLDEPFVANAKKIFTPSPARIPLMILVALFPFLMRFLKLFRFSFIPSGVLDFFVNNITDMIKQRRLESKEESKKRTDFLQLLIDAEIQEQSEDDSKEGSGQMLDTLSVKRLTTDELVGQGILFFIAGYETTGSALNFASYLLATHPDVQDKAYQEIVNVLGDEVPDCDNTSKLRYLENIINETLRLYPPIVSIHRRAAETITLQGVTIPKGSTVFIPTFSIQRDPEIFQDAEKFKPERFDDKLNPLSFLSFGYGPRICIGMRLALVEAKIALVHVLRKVKMETAPDTPVNLTFKSFNVLQPKVPNMLKLSPRC